MPSFIFFPYKLVESIDNDRAEDDGKYHFQHPQLCLGRVQGAEQHVEESY
jgi:hypothetical protein